jgi:hypothetical protein
MRYDLPKGRVPEDFFSVVSFHFSSLGVPMKRNGMAGPQNPTYKNGVTMPKRRKQAEIDDERLEQIERQHEAERDEYLADYGDPRVTEAETDPEIEAEIEAWRRERTENSKTGRRR